MIKTKRRGSGEKGRLRIGDDWNAITIIALSQNNPLKAIAEFVENSIDAGSKTVLIVRAKSKGESYLKIVDDGAGVPVDENGEPNFKYVATHICDSIKRKLKENGNGRIQGEFGIGLLSFWTVGETLAMSCYGTDGQAHQMKMVRGEPGYHIAHRHLLSPFKGTELVIKPLLAGLRQLNGEKIQRYLASELRDRIRQNGVQIKVLDHVARAEYAVEPRQFAGQLIHQLPALTAAEGEVYAELYLNGPDSDNQISLYRSGTRVLASITQLDEFGLPPWTSGYIQGILDAPFLNLTPGTRDGVIRDERFADFCRAVKPLEHKLVEVIEEQKRAQDERSSKQILKTVQTALKEAILTLPEEYDWFEVRQMKTALAPAGDKTFQSQSSGDGDETMIVTRDSDQEMPARTKDFFDFAGPLYGVKVSPGACNLAVNATRNFRALCRDFRNRGVDQSLCFEWKLLEGGGTLTNADGSIVTLTAPSEPGLIRLGVQVRQGNVERQAESLITVTDSIVPADFPAPASAQKGLPGYTLTSATGEIWRSRYDAGRNVVVINNAHRDFVFASKEKSRKLRYICRLFVKELILANFLDVNPALLLERMIELSLYTEENLR